MLSSRFTCLRYGYSGLERAVLSVVPGFKDLAISSSSVVPVPGSSTCTTSQLGAVRHRYYDPNKVTLRHWGYEDKMSRRGPLPRIPRESISRVPGPPYAPKNAWNEKRALFGQNDYIDILGSPEVHPVRIAYEVPYWLKGFRGNEYQMLIRKRLFFGRKIRTGNPDTAENLRKRLKYLSKFLNRKTSQKIWTAHDARK